ncbi:MAG: ABC transporter ATP-binding protein [Firmicutes bacterium]|jgi:branched-chain amino acid transport system ATP-binding protein|nr:ABC transporter ATP-binding protein [Bacillota bacterium]
MLLNVENLNVHYGAIHAIKGVSFTVERGEIVTLIGANGAGKSTILKTISGLIRATSGTMTYAAARGPGGKAGVGEHSVNLGTVPAHKIVDLGISQVPEGRRIFANLTVLDNLELGAYRRQDKAEIAKDLEWVFELFPRLKERRTQVAGTLSGGEQQMLATARGLMSRPDLMLLDEPSMGLAPLLVREIFDTIVKISQTGTTILLVEQNANMALSVANRAYVLETGRISLQGPAKELASDPKVRAAYLGGT